MKQGPAIDFVLRLLSEGRWTFPLSEAEDVLGSQENARRAVYRLVNQGWLFSPTRGFYVIIDPAHRATGFVPVEWFIDDWMSYAGADYYVGALSAAMLHGASHQKPQQVQIVSSKVFREVNRDAYNVAFFYKKAVPRDDWEQHKSPAGYFRVSTPVTTAYDLLRYPKACPSLDLAATVLQELGEKIDASDLASLVDPDAGHSVPVLQRLGYLLDCVGWTEKTEDLAQALHASRLLWQRLDVSLPSLGERDARWRVIVNSNIEADL